VLTQRVRHDEFGSQRTDFDSPPPPIELYPLVPDLQNQSRANMHYIDCRERGPFALLVCPNPQRPEARRRTVRYHPRGRVGSLVLLNVCHSGERAKSLKTASYVQEKAKSCQHRLMMFARISGLGYYNHRSWLDRLRYVLYLCALYLTCIVFYV
jgi:hypothetical protein